MNDMTQEQTAWYGSAPWWAGWLALGVSVLVGAGCGPDRDKLAKDVQEQVRADMDRTIRQEVERRLKAELPRLEARLRARLTGTKIAPPRRVATPSTDPKAVRPAPEPTTPADARKVADQPPAVPADAMEAKAPSVDPQGLVIKRVSLAKKVVERKAQGEGTAFTVADERVYCYIDAQNVKGPERFLSVVWHHNGKVFHKVRLRVGVGHVWRTWAYVRLRKSHVGNWRCGVFNEQGQLLAGAPFAVTE